ncbi:MAG: hypothetical protein U0892_09370 [Pirellulales bacterium]
MRVLLNDDPAKKVIERIAAGRSLIGIVNERRFGEPFPDATRLSDDLFRHAPPEVRETDSLHLAAFPSAEISLLQLFAHSRKDAAMLVTTELPLPDLVQRQSLVWAWFARPTIVRQQLQQGSPMLADRILFGPASIITVGNSPGQVDVFTRPESTQALLDALKAD